MATQKEIDCFVALLKCFGIFQPEEKYKIICPFHEDKNASLQININSAFFFCYGCQKSGSSVELVRNFLSLNRGNFGENFVKLQQKYQKSKKVSSLDINLFIEKEYKKYFNKPIYNNIYNIYNNIGNIDNINNTVKYNYSLVNSPNSSFVVNSKQDKELLNNAREYYYNLPSVNWYKANAKKEIEDEVIMCREYMHKRGFSNFLLSNAQAKVSLNKNYPIILPLLENGIFRGYVMRTFDKEIEEKRKYLYNRGFSRQKCLPGNFKKESCIVCVEGYFDLLKAKQLGIKNCVAFLGWKASRKQLEKIKKANIKIVLCALDNDKAGNEGYRYLKQVKKEYGFNVKRIRYPKGIKDMGDLKENSKEAQFVLTQIKEKSTIDK